MSRSLIQESICLSSEDSDTSQPVEQITNRRFAQRGSLCRCEAHFRVYNDHHLEIDTRGMLEPECHYELDCGFLDPDARRVVTVDWRSAAAFALLTGAALLLAWLSDSIGVERRNLWLPLSALACAAAAALALCLHRFRDNLVFYSRHGRAPLLKLLNRNPSPASLSAFVADIAERSRRAAAQWPDKAEFLSAELREHRRLKDAGIIDARTYETIKQRILDAHGARRAPD